MSTWRILYDDSSIFPLLELSDEEKKVSTQKLKINV